MVCIHRFWTKWHTSSSRLLFSLKIPESGWFSLKFHTLSMRSVQVYIIDFGLAKKYRDPSTHQHIPYR